MARPPRSTAIGQAKAALQGTDDAALRALGDRLGEALAIVGDVSAELGDFLAELPSDASTLEAKLARQGELRNLTRKYAADVDGVLDWAEDARARLAQLDVSEEALGGAGAAGGRARGARSSRRRPT